MVKTEKEYRQDIVDIGRLVYQKGWVAANDGNISIRLDDERVLCTPTAISKGMMHPDDLIICDYVLPGFGGLEALALFRQRGFEIPFIVVSGHIGEDIAVAAMKAGADDYLIKDRLARLGPAVRRALDSGGKEKMPT